MSKLQKSKLQLMLALTKESMTSLSPTCHQMLHTFDKPMTGTMFLQTWRNFPVLTSDVTLPPLSTPFMVTWTKQSHPMIPPLVFCAMMILSSSVSLSPTSQSNLQQPCSAPPAKPLATSFVAPAFLEFAMKMSSLPLMQPIVLLIFTIRGWESAKFQSILRLSQS